MITQAKLDDYIWAGGDDDGWSRSGRTGHIACGDWRFIDGILSEITIIRRGLAADEFKDRHRQKILSQFDSESTYLRLVEYEKTCEKRAGR